MAQGADETLLNLIGVVFIDPNPISVTHIGLYRLHRHMCGQSGSKNVHLIY